MGLKIALSKGMLLEKVGEWLQKKVDEGKKVYDLFICQWCMSTLQTITAHLFAFGLGILPFEWNWQLVIRYPVIVMASSFLCGMTWTVYLTINKIKEKNEEEWEYFQLLNERHEENNNN